MHKVNLRTIDLNLLVILQKLIQTKHITHTAEQLNMSQPAVSRALQRLRQTFDDPILVKTKYGYDISARMSEIHPQLQGTLKNIQQILSEPKFDPTKSTDTIRFFCPDLEAVYFLPNLHQYIRETAPNMRLEIQSQPRNHFDLLKSGDVHFTMSAKTPDTSGAHIKSHQLSLVKQVCIVGKNNPLASQNITINNYLKSAHGIISITEHGNEIGEIDTQLSKMKMKRNITLKLPNFASIPYFCEQSDVIFTMPENIATKLAQYHEIILKPAPKELKLQPFYFYLYWHERNHLDPMCSWIKNALISKYEQEPVA
ncbi:MAG: LysR family transcriptional regulator [Alphaproteobacteria bacterium]